MCNFLFKLNLKVSKPVRQVSPLYLNQGSRVGRTEQISSFSNKSVRTDLTRKLSRLFLCIFPAREKQSEMKNVFRSGGFFFPRYIESRNDA